MTQENNKKHIQTILDLLWENQDYIQAIEHNSSIDVSGRMINHTIKVSFIEGLKKKSKKARLLTKTFSQVINP